MRLIKCNRGVAPIVSTLLLIVITIFAFTLVYGAYNSWISFQRDNSLLQMQERVIIEAFRFNSDDSASVFVFNVGESQVTINQITVNGSSTVITPPSLSIMPGSVSWINMSYYSFPLGNVYALKVITERGTVVETFEKR